MFEDRYICLVKMTTETIKSEVCHFSYKRDDMLSQLKCSKQHQTDSVPKITIITNHILGILNHCTFYLKFICQLLILLLFRIIFQTCIVYTHIWHVLPHFVLYVQMEVLELGLVVLVSILRPSLHLRLVQLLMYYLMQICSLIVSIMCIVQYINILDTYQSFDLITVFKLLLYEA